MYSTINCVHSSLSQSSWYRGIMNTSAEVRCVLCPVAKQPDEEASHPITQEVASFFNLSSTWVDSTICSHHYSVFRKRTAEAKQSEHIQKKKLKANSSNSSSRASVPVAATTSTSASTNEMEVVAETESSLPLTTVHHSLPQEFPMQPIGFVNSVFVERNGTPRQGLICAHTRASIQLLTKYAVDSLEGLQQFSHCWVIFVFHMNTNKQVKPKIHPPRLNGGSAGVYASRTPHRVNAIGLSVCKIAAIAHDTIHLTGIDLLHNTPVLDIKPYTPYDSVDTARCPAWILEDPLVKPLTVTFEPVAKQQLAELAPRLQFYRNDADACANAIEEVLSQDPRSVHMRKKFDADVEIGFCIDVLNVRYRVQDTRAVVTQVELWDDNYSRPQK